MCFKNLPVEFDENGKAHLKEGFAEAYDTQRTRPGGVATLDHAKVRDLLERNGHVKEFNIDPVTRVAGALAFHTVTDLRERKVLETNSLATLFRGYEIILKGRDPRDAIYISSRACGVCGGVHSVTSALALEMAFGVQPPPLGIVVRNLGLAAEFLYDHPLHLGLLAGPDYSQMAVQDTNPEVWERAVQTAAPRHQWHGFKTIGELMTELNPLSGSLYLEALEMTRLCREMYVILHAKYPHPQTIIPGGVTSTVDSSSFTQYYTRLVTMFDYSKKLVAIWDDLIDFLYEVNPDYRKVGQRPMNLIDLGIWDHPEAYDATYANSNEWGEQRWATPGVIVDGTDPNQVYDVTYEAAQRAYKGEGATLIEAKMMRMRGHAMHDAAAYVPKDYFEYWKKRDCNTRMEKYLLDRGWLSEKENKDLVADVQAQIDRDRDIADASPFPKPEEGIVGVYLDNSVKIPFKYGPPKVKEVKKGVKVGEASNVSHYK